MSELTEKEQKVAFVAKNWCQIKNSETSKETIGGSTFTESDAMKLP